jgi:tetratricopeptide (TPR) repeat protein
VGDRLELPEGQEVSATPRNRPGPSISLCMIVRNEERHIARCLASVQGIVDQLIVVDTGSTDRTPEIAADYGAALHRFPWANDFSQARNHALERADGEWVLFLDADEELEPDSRGRLRQVVATTEAEGLSIMVRSFSPPGELVRYQDDYLTRLFRNRPLHRYEQPIHEQIRPSIERQGGRITDSGLTILHYGYAEPTAQGGDARAERNLKLLEQALSRCPSDPYLLYQLGVTQKALGKSTEAYESLSRVLAMDHSCLEPGAMDGLHMKLAQLALAAEDYPVATRHAQSSLSHNPENGVSLYLLALAHMFQGQIRNAYPLFKRLRESPSANLVEVEELDAVLEFCRSQLDATRG